MAAAAAPPGHRAGGPLTRPREISVTGEEIIESFRRGVEAGRVAQAYLVVGPPRGEGRAFAEQALQLLFCDAGTKKPCGECRPCRTARDHTHPDILWVEPEKKSRLISVDQVRDLQRLVYQTSYAGSWKACVMSAADRMQDPAANAFLKTLEEPPAKCVFFLVTDSPQSLLPTIVSRCQRVVVSGDQVLVPEEWRTALVAVLADSSGGSAAAAFSRADRVNKILKAMKEKAEQEESEAAEKGAEVSAGGGLDIDEKTLDARVNARYREMRTGLMQYLLRWYRDILALACGVEEGLVHNGDNLDLLKKKAGAISYRQALHNVKTIEDLNRQLESNLPEGSALGLAFCRLT